jgi:hypothetical protein
LVNRYETNEKEITMVPDATRLIMELDLTLPLLGFYDAPETGGFGTLVGPEPGKHMCIFCFFENFRKGETLVITRDNFGCGGAGNCLCNVQTRSREEYIRFLVEGEGLKRSPEIMGKWVDRRRPYIQQHSFLLMGPVRMEKYEYLKSVTFFVNPDQLSVLIIGANYDAAPDDLPPVIAPFGSGCMELLPLFDDPEAPQAMIGATDIAMRQYLPRDILAFTVTKPMFERLCALDDQSFLHKPFLRNLKKARAEQSMQVV